VVIAAGVAPGAASWRADPPFLAGGRGRIERWEQDFIANARGWR